MSALYHIAFYVPISHAEIVKEQMFAAGAGKLGHYQKCSFEYQGQGQFEPMSGSDPFIGERGKLEKVAELKVEMICEKGALKKVIEAMKNSHPYETPAYYVIETVGI
ncbi:MAG: NGG1p interacting factor NIF3 [Bacteriovoracaceae bacterium]|nr:NGG1p interacting factor NIF3 [Bacteriovoracaceae bacterium]